MQAPLGLASTSPYRADLLARLQLPFESAAPDCDETPRGGEAPDQLALRLARAKADSLVYRRPDALIIGSDQTAATAEGRRLTKPGSVESAIEQLTACSGTTVTFHTAVALADRTTDLWAVTTRVRFRTLDREEIARYVAKEQPLDCAGGFKVEALGISLFDWVRGDDPHALVGLPLLSLSARLRELGYPLP